MTVISAYIDLFIRGKSGGFAQIPLGTLQGDETFLVSEVFVERQTDIDAESETDRL